MGKASSALVQLRIPSRPEYVGVARLAVSGIANRALMSYEDAEDLKLAVAEACTNAIRDVGEKGEIQIDCEIEKKALRITVSNYRKGKPEDAGAYREEPYEDHKTRLGIFLIQALMDEVEYKEDPKMGTCLRMVKYFARAESGE